MAILNNNPLIGASGQSKGYRIERSLRFNSADVAYLNRTPASAGNLKTWTISLWVKLGVLDTNRVLFSAISGSNEHTLYFNSSNIIDWYDYPGSYVGRLQTTQVFRDPSSWYHIVATWDSSNATAGNRMRLYVNGSEVTTFNIDTNPPLNTDSIWNTAIQHRLGGYAYSNITWNGLATEINFIDGQALTPSSFGETDADTGVWKPKAYSGSYGTNGFYLKFADNSGITSTTLGKDSSGNGNNWTPNNFSVTAGAGNDSLVDSPTQYGTDTGAGGEVRGNYCTVNPLDINAGSDVAVSNGNLYYVVSNASAHGCRRSTMSVSSGKWYAECTIATATGGTDRIGILSDTQAGYVTDTNPYVGKFSGGYAYRSNGSSASKENNNTSSTYGDAYTTNDVIGIALDMDAGTITFYKNGVSQGQAYSGLSGSFCFAGSPFNGGAHFWNFGQRPFAYTAPSGFKALCTTNLPTPTIGATATTRANKYFDVVLRTSNGNVGGTYSTTVNMSNGAFLWDKARSINSSHYLLDSVRGISKTLSSDTTGAEANYPNWFTNFGSSSFTTGSDDYTAGTTVVDWIWAANGSGSSNTAGTISSTVSANTTAGFSIVTYTGNGTSGATVGHGCLVNGAATTPSMVILKRRDAVSNWQVKHVSLNANQNLELNSTAAVDTAPGSGYISAISSTTLTLLNGGSAITNVNANTGTYLVYCFAPVAGYSAFGSYTGNGSTDGPMIFTGFRPKWILIKPSSLADVWQIEDAARSQFNVVNDQLFPNSSAAEQVDSATRNTDFLSNGFKIRGTNGGINQSSATYVYACFAENPFKYSLAR
jgi:hypothetical protein